VMSSRDPRPDPQPCRNSLERSSIKAAKRERIIDKQDGEGRRKEKTGGARSDNRGGYPGAKAQSDAVEQQQSRPRSHSFFSYSLFLFFARMTVPYRPPRKPDRTARGIRLRERQQKSREGVARQGGVRLASRHQVGRPAHVGNRGCRHRARSRIQIANDCLAGLDQAGKVSRSDREHLPGRHSDKHPA